MATVSRNVAGAAAATTITAPMTAGSPASGGGTFGVANGAGYPTANFVVVIDRGLSTEEKIFCSSRSANVLTVGTSGRGFDGTAAAGHSNGATLEHELDAAVITALLEHVNTNAGDDHCLSDDTEILTAEGWLNVDALEVGLPAWTFNLETEQAELEPIEAIHRYPAEAFPELVRFKSLGLGEILVTPDHRMVWKRRTHGWRVRAAATMPSQFTLPARAFARQEGLDVPDSLIQIVAWAATEGCWVNHFMTIAQQHGDTADRIRDALVDGGWTFSEYKQEREGRSEMRTFRVRTSDLHWWLSEDKVPRRDLLAMSERQARLFLGELVLGDGSVCNRPKHLTKLQCIERWLDGDTELSMVLLSMNKRFIDFVQEVAVLNGVKTLVHRRPAGIYELSLKQTKYFERPDIDRVPNDRPVWCVTVPENGTLIARRPGSAPIIVGNSATYLNVARHDLTARHPVGTVVPAGAAIDISAIQPDDAAAAGTALTVARADHKHSIVAAVVGAIQPDDTAAEGTATSFARSDHRHSIVAAVAGASAPGDAAAEGSATSFARSDHKHSREAAVLFARKAAAESVTSSTTLQNDDDLFVAVEANVIYEVTMILFPTGAAAGGFKMQFTLPAGSNLSGVLDYYDGSLTFVHLFYNNGVVVTAAVAGVLPVLFRGMLRTSGTTGNMQLQWAQNASNATATQVLTDSFMVARRVT